MALNGIIRLLKYLLSWVPVLTGNRTPTVNVQDNGFVSTQKWKNVKTKKLTLNIERKTEENSGKCPSQNAEPAPQVDYSACGNGMILADTYDGVEADEMTSNVTSGKRS